MDIIIKPEKVMPITMCGSNHFSHHSSNPPLLDLKSTKSDKQDTDIELSKSA